MILIAKCRIGWAVLVVAVAWTVSVSWSQGGSPASDIFLVDINGEEGELKLGNPANITRHDGYDNQPMFLPDNEHLLFASIREHNQADVYAYNTIDRTMRKLIYTVPESEYSPTVMPDGGSVSVVRVEADSTQRLWRFSLIEDNPELLLENVRGIGYHTWVDSNTVALFILGNPHALHLADLRSGTSELIAKNIGRSLQTRPERRTVTFVLKEPEKNQPVITLLDPDSRDIEPLIEVLPGSEDFAWLADGQTLLMAQGARLFSWSERDEERAWREIADLSQSGLRNITRIACSPQQDKLAIVAVPSAD